MPRAPRRVSPPSAEQIRRLNDIGWLESGEVILSEMALLPEDAASTPVARQMLLIHVLNYQGEYDTAVRLALRAIRSAPRSHEVGASLRQLLAPALSRLGHLERAKRILSRLLGGKGVDRACPVSGPGSVRTTVFHSATSSPREARSHRFEA